MNGSIWFDQAVAVLANKGHIEVHLVRKDVRTFIQEYRRFVGREPDAESYSISRDAKVKGGSELRIVLESDDERDKRIVERGLGIKFRSGAGGHGYRKGSRKVSMQLIQAGLDIGRRPPHKRLPSVAQLEEMANQWEENATRYIEGFRKEISREISIRNQRLVDDAKRLKGYKCVVCGFDFAEFYGTHGEGFVEGHHRDPIATYSGPRAVTVDDIDPVCANCSPHAPSRESTAEN